MKKWMTLSVLVIITALLASTRSRRNASSMPWIVGGCRRNCWRGDSIQDQIDGKFGPKTRSAIRKWQREKGYEATGELTYIQTRILLNRRGWILHTFDNGFTYEGQVRNERMHGRGIFTRKDGSSYKGEFVNGSFHGHGIETRVDGTRTEGAFRNGKPHGHASVAWPNADRYEGQHVDGKRTGRGIFVWADGTRYEGEFLNGKMHGRGVFTWKDGRRYEGEFLNDKLHGHGVLIHADGHREEGEWRAGELVAETSTRQPRTAPIRPTSPPRAREHWGAILVVESRDGRMTRSVTWNYASAAPGSLALRRSRLLPGPPDCSPVLRGRPVQKVVPRCIGVCVVGVPCTNRSG